MTSNDNPKPTSEPQSGLITRLEAARLEAARLEAARLEAARLEAARQELVRGKPRKRKFRKRARLSKFDRDTALALVAKSIAEYDTEHEILAKLSKKFGVSELETVRNMIQEALQTHREARERYDSHTWQLMRLTHLSKLTEKREKFAQTAQFEKQLAELQGLAAPQRIDVRAVTLTAPMPSAYNVDLEGLPDEVLEALAAKAKEIPPPNAMAALPSASALGAGNTAGAAGDALGGPAIASKQ